MATALINGIPQNRIGTRNGVDSLDVGRINDKRLDVGCMDFDGTSSKITSGKVEFGTSDFSYGCWVKFDSFVAYSGLVCNRSTTSPNIGTELRIGASSTNLELFTDFGSATVTSHVAVSTLSTGRWYHVVAVLDRSDKQYLYIDGVLMDSDSMSSQVATSITNTDDLLFGKASVHHNGKIADVAIWSRALSASECATLYGASSQLEFDTTNEYVDCGNDTSLQITNNITVAAWFKTDSTGGAYIISKYLGAGGATQRAWYLNIQAGGELYAYIDEGGNYNPYETLKSTATYNDGNWHLGVFTFASGDLKIYADGVSVGVTSGGGSPTSIYNSTASVSLNGIASVGGQGTDALAQASIWNTALTADQIRMLYDQGVGGDWRTVARSGMVGYWPINSTDGYGALIDQKDGAFQSSNLIATPSPSGTALSGASAYTEFPNTTNTIAVVAGKTYVCRVKTNSLTAGNYYAGYHGASSTATFTVSDTNPLNTNEYSSYRFFWVTGSGNLVLKVYSGDSSSTTGDIGLLEFYEISANSGTMVNAESTDLTVATSGGRAADPTVTQYVGGELVVNGSMEVDDNWAVYNSATTSQSSTSIEGSYGRLFTPSGGYGGIKSDTFTVVAGKNYLVEFWVKSPASQVWSQLQDGDGTGGLGANQNGGHSVTAGSWTKVSYIAVVSTGGSNSIVTVQANGSTTSGDFYVDEVTVREVNYANNDLVMYNRLGDGGVAKALGFDGTDERVDLGTGFNTQLASDNWSISIWVNLTGAIDGSTNYHILANEVHNTSGLIVRVDGSTHKILVRASYPTASVTTQTANNILSPTGGWQHLAIIKTGAAIKIYLNAADVTHSAGSHGTNVAATLNLFIGGGGSDGTAQTFKGEMKDFAIFSTALPASEIARIHAAGRDANVREVAKFKQLDFDGDDYVSYDETDVFSTHTSGTFGAWIKTSYTGNYQYILSSGDDASGSYVFGLAIAITTGKLYAYNSQPSDYNRATFAASNIADGNWHYVVLVSSGTEYSIYVDGVSETLTEQSSGDNNGHWFADMPNRDGIDIGRYRRSSPTFYFNGSIAQTSIWSRALSASEISAMYDSGINADWRDGYADDMAGYWRMGDGASGYPIILDEKVPVQLGTDIVLNGNFNGLTASGGGSAGGWSCQSAWSIGSGVATASGGAYNEKLQKDVSLEAGKTYLLQFDQTRTAGSLVAKQYASSTYTDIGTVSDTGSSSFKFTGASGTNGYIYFYASNNFAGTIDNIAIRELLTTGNHGTMTSMAADDITSPLAGYWRLGSGVADSYVTVPDEKDELVFGDDLTTNGAFDSDTGWSKQAGWTISGGNAVATAAASDKQVYQTVTGLTVGKLYRMSITVNSFGGGSVGGYFAEAGTVTDAKETNVLTGAGTATVVGVATNASQYVSIVTRSGASNLTVSGITLREITNPGNIGTTSGMTASNLALTGTVKDESDAAGYIAMDGTGDYIALANAPDVESKFSMEFVAKADDITTGAFIADFYSSSSMRFGVRYDPTGDNFYIYDTGSRSFGQGKVLGDLKIHHIVITVSGTAATLYDNGAAIGTATLDVTPIMNIATASKIGSRHDGTGYFFNGDIYRTSMWNRALTPSEVKQLNALGTHGDPSKLFRRGLKLCYLMGKNEQDTLSKIYDVSGRGNRGDVTVTSPATVHLPANGTPNSIASVLKDSPK